MGNQVGQWASELLREGFFNFGIGLGGNIGIALKDEEIVKKAYKLGRKAAEVCSFGEQGFKPCRQFQLAHFKATPCRKILNLTQTLHLKTKTSLLALLPTNLRVNIGPEGKAVLTLYKSEI